MRRTVSTDTAAPASKRSRAATPSVGDTTEPPPFFAGCESGVLRELALVKAQKVEALKRLEQRAGELREAQRDAAGLRERCKTQETALCAASRAWDELDGVLKAVLSRLTLSSDDSLFAAPAPDDYRRGFVAKMLAEDVADGGGCDGAAAARSKTTQAVLSMVLELLWKNRYAYATVAEQLRTAAKADDAARMLAADNEKLHREMEQAQKALDGLHARHRALEVQHAQSEDRMRALHEENETLRASNAHLQELADAARKAASKALVEASEQAEQLAAANAAATANAAAATTPSISPPPPLQQAMSPPLLTMSQQQQQQLSSSSLLSGIASPKLPPKKFLLQQRTASPAIAPPPAAAIASPQAVPTQQQMQQQQQLAALQAQQYEERVSALARQLEELSSDRDAGRIESARLQSELDNLTETRVQATAYWRTLNEHAENLGRMLAQERARADALANELSAERIRNFQLDSSLAAHKQEIETLQEQLKSVVVERDRIFEQRKVLQMKLDDPSLRPSGVVESEEKQLLRHQEQVCARLRQENAKLTEELQQAARSSSSTSSTTTAQQSQSHPPPPPAISKEALEATLKRQLDELRAQQEDLVTEIGAISSAYEETTEQNARLLKQLAEREDATLRAAKEKIRLELAVRAASDERDQLKQTLAEAQRRTQSVAADAAAKEGRAREMGERLQAALGAAQAARAEMEAAQRAAADAQLALGSATAQAETFKGLAEVRAKELANAAEGREKDRLDVLRVQKDAADLRERLAAASAGTADSEQVRRLEEELDVFRAKFRCPLCSDRTRDTIIRRCSHTFCEHCIQKSLKSRQRKCPSCLQPFSESDLCHFYL